MDVSRHLIWAIALAATLGVLVRPWRTPEAVWAVAGAAALLLGGLLPWRDGLVALGRSVDVCLFLTGMMLLSEVARQAGLFDSIAALAVNWAKGSRRRLFLLVYGAGVVVTAFLSNDATAVVLTPAVFAAAKRAKADPLPHLFACAMVANAASFVLPISNPANLVLWGDHTPPLGPWLASFAFPSALAIAATFLTLGWAERRGLAGDCAMRVDQPRLTREGWIALAGVGGTVLVLLAASLLGRPLGLPTAIMGTVTLALTLVPRRGSPVPVLSSVSWSILPLVAGLFVVVEGLARTGLIDQLASLLQTGSAAHPTSTAWAAGGAIAAASNLVNNLPAGLVASLAAVQSHAPRPAVDAMLIGVDLGPNLSVTGSLATILWLAAIRREGEHVGFWRFLRVGAWVMPPALILALGARLLSP